VLATPDYLAAGCGILAIVGQIANIILHLRIRTAVLEGKNDLLQSEGRLKEWVEDKLDRYVDKDICGLRHRSPGTEKTAY
jgi:hypothetical protein